MVFGHIKTHIQQHISIRYTYIRQHLYRLGIVFLASLLRVFHFGRQNSKQVMLLTSGPFPVTAAQVTSNTRHLFSFLRGVWVQGIQENPSSSSANITHSLKVKYGAPGLCANAQPNKASREPGVVVFASHPSTQKVEASASQDF